MLIGLPAVAAVARVRRAHRDPLLQVGDDARPAACPSAASSGRRSWRTAVSSRLSAGLPGTTAGPLSPPLRIASRVSRCRPPCCLLRLGRVARVAVFDQDGADLRLEELDAGVGRPTRTGRMRGRQRYRESVDVIEVLQNLFQAPSGTDRHSPAGRCAPSARRARPCRPAAPARRRFRSGVRSTGDSHASFVHPGRHANGVQLRQPALRRDEHLQAQSFQTGDELFGEPPGAGRRPRRAPPTSGTAAPGTGRRSC